jgi:chemotaxis protein MotB
MHVCKNKRIAVLVGALSVSLLSGCTNWQLRYKNLNDEHESLKGQKAKIETEKGQLAEKVAQDQQTIEDLMKQLGEGKSVGVATGFEGMDVKWSGSEGTITVTVQDSILFSAGAVTLKSATIQQLDRVASVIKEKYSGKLIDVIGHTDSDPIRKSKWVDNLQLSTERANAVNRYLTKHGLHESQVRSVGRGASDPKVDNSSAAGKAKNRRVEIVVHMK